MLHQDKGRERDALDAFISHLPKRVRAIAKGLRKPLRKPLFGGFEQLFKEMLRDVHVYGEYGMGASTRWVDAETEARILSVDTSQDWVQLTRENMTRSGHSISHIDVGPLAKWGRPTELHHREAFVAYMEALFLHDVLPDCVLIDGRFRVGCFLTALARSAPGTRILFDDYTERPKYHIVETLVAPKECTERQALFVVPQERDHDRILGLRAEFETIVD